MTAVGRSQRWLHNDNPFTLSGRQPVPAKPSPSLCAQDTTITSPWTGGMLRNKHRPQLTMIPIELIPTPCRDLYSDHHRAGGGLVFNSRGNRAKLYQVTELGDMGWKTWRGLFMVATTSQLLREVMSPESRIWRRCFMMPLQPPRHQWVGCLKRHEYGEYVSWN